MNIPSRSSLRFARRTARAFALLAIVASLVGCGGGRALDASLVSIAVTPATPAIRLGMKQQFTATGTFADGSTRNLTTMVSWASATMSVATISAAGEATALAPGSTFVTATTGTISGGTTLTAFAGGRLVSITVTPDAPVVGIGRKQQFTATGTFDDGSTQNLTTMVTWASATMFVATISAAGEATAIAVGTTFITATSGTVSGGTTLSAATGAELVSIAVTPPSPMIARGTKQQFTATGTFDDATIKDVTSLVTWASATPAVATIATTGEATAVAAGTAVITATSGAISGNATLTVASKKLVSIAVTPAFTTLNIGRKLQYIATGTFDDNSTQDLTTMVTWASATPSVAIISLGGEATAVGFGNTVITATSGTISGSATLTGTSIPLVSITVTPALPTISKGTKQQFTATGIFTDASTQDLTSMVTWTSATPATATIATTGEATALAAGTTVISAGLGALSGSTKLTVTGAKLLSIAVTPAMPAISKGTKQQFIATGIFDDATTQNLTTIVTWASATAATATISNAAGANGEATAVATGTTIISATLGTISGSTQLTVTTPPLVSIAVTPAMPSIAKGTKLQLTATGTYGDNSTQDVTASATWASATTATATVSNAGGTNGQATAVGEGTTVISATIVGGIMAMVTLTVTPAKLVSIAVTPSTPTIGRDATLRFVATGTFSDGTTQDLSTSVTWASSTTATATISNAAGSNGLATPISLGTTVISAVSGSVSGSTTLTVSTARILSITVTPALPTIAKGTTNQFVATAFFNDGTTMDVTLTATWASATPAVATISNDAGSKGLASSLAEGNTVISATLGLVSGTTTLEVSAAQ